MANNMLKLKNDPKLVVFGFHFKSLSWPVKPHQPLLWTLGIDTIQHYQQYIQIEDWSKLSGVQFSLQVFVLNDGAMAATLWFLVMAAIQDDWQHVQIEDCAKHSGVWFSLEVFISNSRAISPIFMTIIFFRINPQIFSQQPALNQ